MQRKNIIVGKLHNRKNQWNEKSVCVPYPYNILNYFYSFFVVVCRCRCWYCLAGSWAWAMSMRQELFWFEFECRRCVYVLYRLYRWVRYVCECHYVVGLMRLTVFMWQRTAHQSTRRHLTAGRRGVERFIANFSRARIFGHFDWILVGKIIFWWTQN